MNDNANILENISELHAESLLGVASPSVYIKHNDYVILCVRFIHKTSEGLKNKSINFHIKESSVSLFNGEVQQNLGSFKEMYSLLSNNLEYELKLVENYSDTLDALEEQLLEKNSMRMLNNVLFELKRDLLKLNRTIERMSLVLNEFYKKEKGILSDFQLEYNDLLSDTEVLMRYTKGQIEKVENMFHFYTAVKNESLNKNLYILAVLSGIFLPLNLIVGFFGMNTSGLFLSKSENGTIIVFYTILGIFVFLLIGIPLINYIDKILFSKFLGRFGIYSKLSKKLEKVSSDFNIL
jgi:Mg2+ and Co2+ transporter CorA